MKRLQCRNCGKFVGAVNENDVLDDEPYCLCEECYKEAMETKVDVTIIQTPVTVKLTCPYCDEEIEFDYDDTPYSHTYWGDVEGETIECPECGEYIKLGKHDID